MSIEAEALLQEAKESIEAAQNYRSELQHRVQGLDLARQQIKGSATQTRAVLVQHFQELQGTVSRLLEERLAALLLEVDAIEQDSVRPLDDCQKLIEQGVSTADELLREGEAALRCGVGEQDDKLGSFTKKALQIQLDSLPEVPSLAEVSCLSAQLDDSLLPAVKGRICTHGSVASHPPVQIDELVERPGGILVRWCKVDDDFAAQDYRLQYRRSASSHFEDAYVGQDSEYLVLHLDPHTEYLFRVCARGDGRWEWSPWSIPQTACTTLAPHEWSPGSEEYSLSSRRDIALKNDSPLCGAGVLYSQAPTYCCRQTLTFKIISAGQPDKRDSVGVCVDRRNGQDSLQRDQAVCITTSGAVFVNGKEMTNQLPAISTGSAVTFDMEVVNVFPVNINNNEGASVKLRVTIGSGSREVVFDWLLEQVCEGLFFGCSFTHPGWKVFVF
ncbi:cytokine receptor-like factor 3 [Acipenser ruthenus]|uniref:cytokine receptor-like factor 3 n=1 Tax=Acipenser ruthenus TaxID=7906 RepID=UPI00145A596A|nr:cytokine receptor-like factor 3 [Acipenser ruthenus]XP_058845720.1 cytokine receptor-like factor 3 [Acipenser ruthenus]XP_058845721.1 cytokine receptor-like factor 3 [Acipenser ruthenus]